MPPSKTYSTNDTDKEEWLKISLIQLQASVALLQVRSQNSYTLKHKEHLGSLKIQKLHLAVYFSHLCSTLSLTHFSLQQAKRRNLQTHLLFRKPGFYPCRRVLHSLENLCTSVISSTKHVAIIIRELILYKKSFEKGAIKAPSVFSICNYTQFSLVWSPCKKSWLKDITSITQGFSFHSSVFP